MNSFEPACHLLDGRIENESVPMCQAYDLGITMQSSLAQGLLACRYRVPKDLLKGSRSTRKSVYAEQITQKSIEVCFKLVKRAPEKVLP